MAEDEETTSKGIQSPKSYESDKGNLYQDKILYREISRFLPIIFSDFVVPN